MLDKKYISKRAALKHNLGFTDEEIDHMETELNCELNKDNIEPKFWTILKTPEPKKVSINDLTVEELDAMLEELRDILCEPGYTNEK